MATRSTLALVVALLGSLAFNVRLVLARPSASVSTSAPPSAVPRREPESPDVACEVRLKACEQNTWDVAQKAITVGRAARASPADAGVLGTGADAQAAALCAKAKANLRDTWRRDREVIAAGLVATLGDQAEQEKNLTSELARMRDDAHLDDQEAASLASAYRERRLARMAEGRAALLRNPQDFPALLQAAHGLYQDEDALLERIGGDEAKEAWRTSQLEGRTVILAICASMAEEDWDDAIRW
jgi:hypothetical protein